MRVESSRSNAREEFLVTYTSRLTRGTTILSRSCKLAISWCLWHIEGIYYYEIHSGYHAGRSGEVADSAFRYVHGIGLF